MRSYTVKENYIGSVVSFGKDRQTYNLKYRYIPDMNTDRTNPEHLDAVHS